MGQILAVIRPCVALAIFLLAACANYADFSLEAYKNATGIKAKSLALIAKSEEPYARHSAAAEALMLDIDTAYEFARGIDNNEEATEMWRLIRSPRDNLVGNWEVFWRETRPNGLSEVFVDQFREEVGFAFDRLICLEANKRESVGCNDIEE